MTEDLAEMLGCAVSLQAERALFLVHTPWLGPSAYLHVLFKPATELELARAPPLHRGFLRRHNGAALFRAAERASIELFGSVIPVPVSRLGGVETEAPYDIVEANEGRPESSVVVGEYYADSSLVVVSSSGVHRESDDGRRLSGRWQTVGEWLTSEVARLKTLFNAEGKFLGRRLEATLPK